MTHNRKSIHIFWDSLYLNGVVFDKVLLVIPIQLWLVVHYVKSLFSSLLTGMVKQIFGSYKVTYHPDGPEGEAKEIDFTPPFRRLRMFPDLEKALGCSLPKPDTLHTEEARLHLDRICAENQVKLFFVCLIVNMSLI